MEPIFLSSSHKVICACCRRTANVVCSSLPPTVLNREIQNDQKPLLNHNTHLLCVLERDLVPAGAQA